MTRRQLGRRLRHLRELAGKTELEVEAARLASRTKLWRIETGRSSVKMADVRALCWLYGADQKTTDSLAALADGTTSLGWWDDIVYPGRFYLFIALEETACQMLRYEAELVFGLFQTPDYARALFSETHPEWPDERVDDYVRVRLKRQEVLDRTPPPHVSVVLNEAVFQRPVGGDAVMAGQISRLRELDHRWNIEIRVLPWSAGTHPAMQGAFTIFDFEGPDDPSVAYYDSLTEARYLEKPAELTAYRGMFDRITRQSVSLKEYL